MDVDALPVSLWFQLVDHKFKRVLDPNRIVLSDDCSVLELKEMIASRIQLTYPFFTFFSLWKLERAVTDAKLLGSVSVSLDELKEGDQVLAKKLRPGIDAVPIWGPWFKRSEHFFVQLLADGPPSPGASFAYGISKTSFNTREAEHAYDYVQEMIPLTNETLNIMDEQLCLISVYDSLWKQKENLDKYVAKSGVAKVPMDHGGGVREDYGEVPEPIDETLDDEDDVLQGDDASKTVIFKTFNLTMLPGYKPFGDALCRVLHEKIFVREEYEILYNFISEEGNEQSNILLTGHPGIGKTTFLTYCLLRRLTEGKPTAILLHEHQRYLFTTDGVYLLPRDPGEVRLFLGGHLEAHLKTGFKEWDFLILYDLNSNHTTVNSRLCPWRTVVCTSPQRDRYKNFMKYEKHLFVTPSPTYTFLPWNRMEIFSAREEFSRIKRTDEEWNNLYFKYGGSARLLFQYEEERLESNVRNAAYTVDPSFAINYAKSDDWLCDAYSHRLVMAGPDGNVNTGWKRSSMISRISVHVSCILATTFCVDFRKQLVTELRRRYRKVEGGTKGILFEGFGHRYMERALKESNVGLSVRPLCARKELFRHAEEESLTFVPVRDGTIVLNEWGIPSPEKLQELQYYRRPAQDFSGFDSFIFRRPTENRRGLYVFFLFTLQQENPVDLTRLVKLWTNVSDGKTWDLWDWTMVFVVSKPLEGSEAQCTSEQRLTINLKETTAKEKKVAVIISKKLRQYVHEIDFNAFLRF